MDIYRLFSIYVISLGVCIFFLYLGIKILKRDSANRVNQYFSGFFFLVAFALIINYFYPWIQTPQYQVLANTLHKFTLYLVLFAFSLLLLGVIQLDSSKNLSIKYQIILLALYGVLCSIIFFIPDGAQVKIPTPGIQESPEWSFSFFSFILTVAFSLLCITFFYTRNLYRKFHSEILIKKLKYFIAGISLFYFLCFYICFMNYFDLMILRMLYMLVGLLHIPGGILIYKGIGKAPKTLS